MTKDASPKELRTVDHSARHAPLAMDAATFRELGHRLVDQLAEFLDSLPRRLVTHDESPSAIRNALDLFPRGVERFFNAAVEDRMQDVFLALEVQVDGAVGDPGFARDVGDFRIEVTVVGEDAGSGAQDCLTFIANSGAHSG